LIGCLVSFARVAQSSGWAANEISASVEFARQLAEDGCRAAAMRECRRILAAAPDQTGAAALLSKLEASGPARGAAGCRSFAGWITGGIVRMYRRWVGPAIGARCSLTPSCSEYFLQAGRRHGWLAFPMMADRLVREPSVVAAAEVRIAGRIADPLEDHDGWMVPRRR